MSREERARPQDYFTPRTPVSREMFARREEGRLQQRLEDTLVEQGSQIMLYGDTGVGKTSLLLHVAREMGLGVVRVECFSGKTFTDLIRDAFAGIAEVQELRLEVTEETRNVGEGGGEVGFPVIARLKGRLLSESTTTETREFEVVEQSIVDALIDKLVESGIKIIFFDNFENVEDAAVKSQVAEFIGFISDRAAATGNLKVVLAGIADTAGELLTLSSAASRRTVEFEVPRMPERELARIVKSGMDFLRLQIPEKLVREVTKLSDGFPYVTHLLGLHLAREMLRQSATEASDDALRQAVSISLAEFREEFRASYDAAQEMSGQVRPREHVMEALAWADGRDFRAPDIGAIYRKRFHLPSDTGLAFLNPALGQLITPRYGAVLRRRGSRRRYRYSFSNPLMRPFIRLRQGARET